MSVVMASRPGILIRHDPSRRRLSVACLPLGRSSAMALHLKARVIDVFEVRERVARLQRVEIHDMLYNKTQVTMHLKAQAMLRYFALCGALGASIWMPV